MDYFVCTASHNHLELCYLPGVSSWKALHLAREWVEVLTCFFFPKCFRHTDSVDLELCLVSDHTNESSWQKFHNEKTKIPVISFCKKDGWPFKFFFFYVCNLINLMRLQSTQLGMGVTIVIHQTFIRSWMLFYSFFIIADRSSVLCAFLNLFKWIHKFHIPCHLYQK